MCIKLYSLGCPRCEVLKEKLKQASINFDVVDDMNILVSMGFNEVPILEVDGKILNFREAIDWVGTR